MIRRMAGVLGVLACTTGAAMGADDAHSLARVLSDVCYVGHLRQAPLPAAEAAALFARASRSSDAALAEAARATAEPYATLTALRERRDAAGLDPQSQARRRLAFLSQAIGDPEDPRYSAKLEKALIGDRRNLSRNLADSARRGAPNPADGGSIAGSQIESANTVAMTSREIFKSEVSIREVWASRLQPLLLRDAGRATLKGLEARVGVVRGYVWLEIRNTAAKRLTRCAIDVHFRGKDGQTQHFHYYVPELPPGAAFRPSPQLARLVTAGVKGMNDTTWPGQITVSYSLASDQGRVKETDVAFADGAEVRRGLFLEAFAEGRTYAMKDRDGKVTRTLHITRSQPSADPDSGPGSLDIAVQISDARSSSPPTQLEGTWTDTGTQSLAEQIIFEPVGAPAARKAEEARRKATAARRPSGAGRLSSPFLKNSRAAVDDLRRRSEEIAAQRNDNLRKRSQQKAAQNNRVPGPGLPLPMPGGFRPFQRPPSAEEVKNRVYFEWREGYVLRSYAAGMFSDLYEPVSDAAPR